MTRAEFNAYCRSLPRTTHVVQWGDADVWKVAGKVFAIGGWDDGKSLYVTFKCTPTAFEILKEQPGLRPAPYLASRGLTWIQRTGRKSMNDAALRDYLSESYHLVAAILPKRVRQELGLLSAEAAGKPVSKNRAKSATGKRAAS